MNNEFSNGELHSNNGYGPIKTWYSRTKVPKGFKFNQYKFWELKNN